MISIKTSIAKDREEFFSHPKVAALANDILVDNLADDQLYQTYLANAQAMRIAKTKASPLRIRPEHKQPGTDAFTVHKIGVTRYALLPKPTQHRQADLIWERLGARVFVPQAQETQTQVIDAKETKADDTFIASIYELYRQSEDHLLVVDPGLSKDRTIQGKAGQALLTLLALDYAANIFKSEALTTDEEQTDEEEEDGITQFIKLFAYLRSYYPGAIATTQQLYDAYFLASELYSYEQKIYPKCNEKTASYRTLKL